MSQTMSGQRRVSRAKTPTTRRKFVKRLFWLACLLAFVVGGYHAVWRYHLKRFQAVRPAVLYRVAQPTKFGLWHLIKHHDVRTVINTRRYQNRLAGGVFDPGEPSGPLEADYVRQLGARYLQWPLGDEPCWPWPTPWTIEEFFRLLDDPDNHPVVLHCMGGRHRTGTLAALFRLEYDRWSVERALEELYAFDFGHPIPLQEHNLRTYLSRPRPEPEDFSALAEAIGPLVESRAGRPPRDYEELVHWLRTSRRKDAIHRALKEYLEHQRPFAICLAHRMIDTPMHPLVPKATRAAAECLRRPEAAWCDWAIAAALIADAGTPNQQRALVELLEQQDRSTPPTERYQAAVAGVTNRYTANRIPYLRPILADERRRPEKAAAGTRYCDTAVARLSVILQQNLVEHAGPDGTVGWESGLRRARKWFDENPPLARLGPLVPPRGKNAVKIGQAPTREDLSRLK